MNFSISSSRRKPFWITLGVALGLVGAVDASIRLYVRQKTSRERFIDCKESKFQHLAYQSKAQPFDAIFVGSSFTKNHVSTAAFATRGFRIYNLGISGRLLADFPSMASAAVGAGPRLVVLDLSLDELFCAPSSNFVHLKDLGPLLLSSGDVATMAKHAWSFGLSLHALHYYREPIYEQLRGGLGRLVPPPSVQRSPSPLGSNYEDQQMAGIDCEVFKVAVYDKMKVLTCTNGDGAQLGYLDRNSPDLMVRFDIANLNRDALELLNSVIDSVGGQAKALVVLQPMRGRVVQFDLVGLEALIHAPVIDLSSATFSDRDWCDDSHFNLYGRAKYSSLLAELIAPYLGSASAKQ